MLRSSIVFETKLVWHTEVLNPTHILYIYHNVWPNKIVYIYIYIYVVFICLRLSTSYLLYVSCIGCPVSIKHQ